MLLFALEALPRLAAVPAIWPLWQRVVLRSAQAIAIWTLLGPLLWWLAGRIPRDRPRLASWFLLGLSVLATTAVDAAWTRWTYQALTQNYISWWASRGDRVLYMGVALVAARVARDRLRSLAARAEQLYQRHLALRSALLHRLDRELQPHFLFNALNTVAELIHHNAELAGRLVDDIVTLFETMGAAGPSERTLREEIGSLEPYFGIQQSRFGTRFAVRQHVPNEAAAAFVPSLILQPLIENAIRHGIEPLPQGGVVTLDAERLDSTLVLRVSNPLGAALPSPAPNGGGIGLANVRERLRCLYDGAASLTLERAEGLAMVTLRIPLKTQAQLRGVREDSEELQVEAAQDASNALSRQGSVRFAIRGAAAAWSVMLVLWLIWSGLTAAASGVSQMEILGSPGYVARELSLYFGTTVAVILFASWHRVERWPRSVVVLAQISVGVALFALESYRIAHLAAPRQAQLGAAALLGTRTAGYLAIVAAVNTWRWHVEHLMLSAEAWRTSARHAQLLHEERRQALDPAHVVAALRRIAAVAPSNPNEADRLVVALSRELRATLAQSAASPFDAPQSLTHAHGSSVASVGAHR